LLSELFNCGTTVRMVSLFCAPGIGCFVGSNGGNTIGLLLTTAGLGMVVLAGEVPAVDGLAWGRALIPLEKKRSAKVVEAKRTILRGTSWYRLGRSSEWFSEYGFVNTGEKS
jgi:hypothetical protein